MNCHISRFIFEHRSCIADLLNGRPLYPKLTISSALPEKAERLTTCIMTHFGISAFKLLSYAFTFEICTFNTSQQSAISDS